MLNACVPTDDVPTDTADIIVCEETSPSDSTITDADVFEYGRRLGVHVNKHVAEELKEITHLVRSCLLEPLPSFWIPCFDRVSTHWFYFNTTTGDSSWTHPLEESHKQRLEQLVNSFSRNDKEIRGNPEGACEKLIDESTAFSSKLPTMIGANTLKPLPPRTLAPLRKAPPTFDAPPTVTNQLSAKRNLLMREPSIERISKPENGPTMSFTERLAAKRATRTNFGKGGPDLAATVTRKVHFEEEKPKAFQYSPEISENVEDEFSESSESSNELLDLVGDAGDLLPAVSVDSRKEENLEKLRKSKELNEGSVSGEKIPGENVPVEVAGLDNQEQTQDQNTSDTETKKIILKQEERLEKLRQELELNLEKEKEKLEQKFQDELEKFKEESEDRLRKERETWNVWLEQEKLKVQQSCEETWKSEKERLVKEVEEREEELRKSFQETRRENEEKWRKEKEELEEHFRNLLQTEREAKENLIKEEMAKIEEEFRQLTMEKRTDLMKQMEELEKKFREEVRERQEWFENKSRKLHDETENKMAEESKKYAENLKLHEESMKKLIAESNLRLEESSAERKLPEESRKVSEKQEIVSSCHCDQLQKQLERMQQDMEFLKRRRELDSDADARPSSSGSSRRVVFRKVPSKRTARPRAVPLKATRMFYANTDEDSESSSSDARNVRFREEPKLRHRSRSLNNLSCDKSRERDPLTRAQYLVNKHKGKTLSKLWVGLEEVSTELSSDTATSGISSSLSSNAWMAEQPHQSMEWDGVMRSIRKISGDLQDVWVAIGNRSATGYRPASAHHWSSANSILHSTSAAAVPLSFSSHASTAEKTRALRQWLQKTNSSVQ